MSDSATNPRPIVLYDRDCGFCRWALGKVLAWDRSGLFRPVALQDPEAAELLAGMDEEERMASWHFVIPPKAHPTPETSGGSRDTSEGMVRSGGAAFEPMLRLLPGGRALAGLAGEAPGLTDRAYRFVSSRRTSFGPHISDSAKRRADDRISQRAS